MLSKTWTITVTVNGQPHTAEIETRLTLADFLREELDLTGTHLACEHGVCGNCTVLVDGASTRSCLMFAVQADGCEVTTVEGLAHGEELHPLQQSFWENHGLQCGFCTPAMLLTSLEFLRSNPTPSDEEIREAIAGVLCRCTGYQNIVSSVRLAAGKVVTESATPGQTMGLAL
jgi:carbon-monoxide dehydrogenase small subunit